MKLDEIEEHLKDIETQLRLMRNEIAYLKGYLEGIAEGIKILYNETSLKFLEKGK